ncbi:MAG: wapA1 [Proteobacteria bacterium]|nr:wapA1 [Pseudomonadota bacterium]
MRLFSRNSGAYAFVLIGLSISFCVNYPSAAEDSTLAAAQKNAPNSAILSYELAGIQLPEPLVPINDQYYSDIFSLSNTLREEAERPDKWRLLRDFSETYPNSAWAPAVNTNLGLLYLHDGYFSRAESAWRAAWISGKDAQDPAARALIDRAVGELARLYANLGKMDDLERLFQEIGDRPVVGSATEDLQVAREILVLSKKDPRHLFNCGPLALKALSLALGIDPAKVDFLQWLNVGPNGTNLSQVANLADKVGLGYHLVQREPGQTVPVPSLVHWRVGHFAAIVGMDNGRYHVKDAVFPASDIWVTPEALDAEASGYFLVPSSVRQDTRWQVADASTTASVWGKGPTNGTPPGDNNDPTANGNNQPFGSVGGPWPDNNNPPVEPNPNGNPPANTPPNDQPPNDCGMCTYNIKESSVSVFLTDIPVGYRPAIGPSAEARISYNQREDSQPQNFNYSNVGQKWTLNWVRFVADDPSNAGANVYRTQPQGGAYYYSSYSSSSGAFSPQNDDGSILIRTGNSPIAYRRLLRDGSAEIYAQSDGSTTYPRRVFLTAVIDSDGNTSHLNYDGGGRLTSLTDALGRNTSFTYGLAAQPLKITRITDPFGRAASLTYDSSGRLASITDTIGITSSFAYDANWLVNGVTTPYGATSFAYTAPGTSGPPRFVQITDPLGKKERVEWLEPAPIPDSEPASTVPVGMPVTPTNQYLTYRNSFYWDKNAYVVAGCTDSGGCDYTKARIRHFAHVNSTSLKSTVIESVKYPLENRIWYAYPGQSASLYSGSYSSPIAIGRVLDDGTTQIRRFSYDTSGYFNLTKASDGLGRTTNIAYANQVDVAAISQSVQYGQQATLAQFIYDARHRPTLAVDAAGQKSNQTYNGAGQLLSRTNALGETTTYTYDSQANLASITNANGHTAASFTYDAAARVRTYTDSEGWTATYDYDDADRPTKVTYPDGTTTSYTYDRLDLASYTDRLHRKWRYTHDAMRRLTAVTDPIGNVMAFGYDGDGRLTSFTDAKSNVTTWTYDVQGRLSTKHYADGGTVTYTYEATTSRLKSITDPLGQVKQFAYGLDDRLTGITYLNAVNATPAVSFAYDPYYPWLTAMTDGTGTRSYSYNAPFSLGALRPSQECFVATGSGPACTHSIAYGYDALGRLNARTVSGNGAETFAYDALGRLSEHDSDLGAFTLSYLGETGQPVLRKLGGAGATLQTAWGYLPNSGDRRLASIGNTGLTSGQYSNFAFDTTPENQITGITETSDAATAYPEAGTQTATYNAVNELTDLSGQAFTYDANGNLTSDGTHTYSWDADNRLIGIAYSGTPGKATTFSYDGLGRRTTISHTPAGGGAAVASNYVWCGDKPCQVRDAANQPARAYYTEGERLLGSSPSQLFYGVDQLGSVRRVFESPTSAPAYSYDPYGVPLQTTASITDFGYAGLFTEPDSGLGLATYRAYDPSVGRWISRDPIGEMGDQVGNLYEYVGSNTPVSVDPMGLAEIPTPYNVPGGPYSPAGPGQQPGTYYGPPQQSGTRTICRWVPPQGEGGPPGSQGYWKTQMSGQKGWSRYDQSGSPITPNEAHPNTLPSNPIPPYVRFGGAVGVFVGTVFYTTPAY